MGFRMQNYSLRPTSSWEELGEVGEQKVSQAIPKGFSHFRNKLVPCQYDNDYEEIDLIVIGTTGIWSIEVKSWRGIAYHGDYPEEIVFVRNTPDGRRTSNRYNPFYQARNHAQDLHSYLAYSLKEWFPSIHTLVVFASRDRIGVNGVNLERVRRLNPSIIYLDEMPEVITDNSNIVRGWREWYRVKDALSKLGTWDVIYFTSEERKRALLCQWSGLKIRTGTQTIPIKWEDLSRVEVMQGASSRLPVRFVYRSGDIQVGRLLDDTIPVQFPKGGIERIKLSEITEIRTGFSPKAESQTSL